MNKLFPNVTSLKKLSGNFNYDKLNVFFKDMKVNVFISFNKEFSFVDNIKDANVIFELDESLNIEGYKIVINDNKIVIYYSEYNGAYYALQTLKQILSNKEIPNLEIFDEPKTKVRGYMFDISRDKVSTVQTIKKVIDLMAELKMNHFELYVEGFSFEYKSFEKFLQEEGYITVSEYLEIQKYCNDRFIDFVGNENGFGHMAKWLETDEYKDLAVCPDGIMLWGRFRKPTTLNPLDPRSLELVKKMYSDMIPLTTSKYFNMNFDEPFELGHGATEGMCVEDIYLDYTKKCYDEIKKYNKTPMMWGDVLIKHPNSWDKLPQDMIFIDWGYDGFYSFEKHAKALHDKNVKFMLAPGTTSWCSYFGRFLDWFENIKNSLDACYKYNGEGVILTDWGDFGHQQFLSVTYAPLVFFGLYGWNLEEGTILNIRGYLNDYIFKDSNQVIGDVLMSLSEYSSYETNYLSNGTKTFHRFMWSSCAIMDNEKDPIGYYKNKIGTSVLSLTKHNMLFDYLDLKLKELNEAKLEKDLITVDEIKQNINLIKMILDLDLAFNKEVSKKVRIKKLKNILKSQDDFINNQRRVWLNRCKKGGLESNIYYITSFLKFVKITLDYLKEE